MRIYSDENLIIRFDRDLAECVENSIYNFHKGNKFVEELFGCRLRDIGKVKTSFFTKREEFLEYIKLLDANAKVPDWATGCFFGGESQILINSDDEKDIIRRKYTLLHEAIHLLIEKTIYERHKIDRIVWFDESLACFLDRHIENVLQQELKEIAKKLKPLASDFDMNKLNDFSIVKTKEYDGYDMFLIIGKYLVQTGLAKEYIDLIKRNPDKIIEEGKTILQKAIKFVEKE